MLPVINFRPSLNSMLKLIDGIERSYSFSLLDSQLCRLHIMQSNILDVFFKFNINAELVTIMNVVESKINTGHIVS